MPRRSKSLTIALAAAGAFTFAVPIFTAADTGPVPELRFHDGQFEPANVTVPAGQPVKLKVDNTGASAIEFESFELNRERVVLPGASITVYIPALTPGVYHFYDDFHHQGNDGVLTAK
jgi:heme/copper-type cytochrome/quinol oxidase subunit 2